MPSTLAVSVVEPRTSRPGCPRMARIALVVLGLLTAAYRVAEAQTVPEQQPGWEFLVSGGTVVPTGAQRDAIKRGHLSAAQLSYRVHPVLAITATLGWARSRDIASTGDPKLDLFTYDLGAEVRARRWLVGDITVSPFAGAGAGARSYNYRSLHVAATHNLAAYASAGGEVGVRRVHLRLEVRDYLSGFKPLGGEGRADTRNDIAMMLGLRFGTR